VTLPPNDRPTPDASGAPAPGPGQAYPAAAPPDVPAAHRSRAGLAVAATLAGALVLGGTGYAVASYLSGGGSQPEDVLPADTLGFVKLDLDPAAGQKMALGSLLEKFPDLVSEGKGDLKEQLLEPLLDESGAALNYESDVEPWLGDRLAVAAVPAEGTEEGVVPVAALAVTDAERMAEVLTRAQQDAGFGFALRGDYVLITDSQERAESIAAAETSLADDADFTGDRDALGGDQIALAWADLSAAQSILATQVPADSMSGIFGGDELSGRMILGVHAEDDAVELVGLDFGVSDFGEPSSEPTRLMQGLPEDTLGAVSASEVGDRVVALWDELEQSGALAGAEEPLTQLGLDLPEDLRIVFGTDLVVAAFGEVANPRVGARVVTEDGARAAEIVDDLLAEAGAEAGAGVELVPAPVEDGYVLGTDAATGDELAAGDGGLGSTDAFRAAVADPDDASAMGYVDLAAVIDQLIAEGGETGKEAATFAAVDTFGFSATSTDEGGRFVLRITTR
jgi:hypothetical protein